MNPRTTWNSGDVMNRRSRHLMVLAIAIITASIASFGVYRAVDTMPAKQITDAHQPVVVAKRSMAIGTQLTEQDVKVIAWPAESVVPGAIGSVKEVVNRGLLTAVLLNEPITSNKLASADTGAGLPPAIPPGMRAISVRVNDVIGVAGFVVPGSRVDLVVTIRRQTDSMTRTVASNVQVLTSGTKQDQEKPGPDGKAAPASTVVTLMVAPEDAERIALAQSEGQIMLVLRNPLDVQPTVTSGVRTAALLGQSDTPAPEVKPAAPPRRIVVKEPHVEPPPPPPQPRMVEAIRAAKRTDEVIK
jgi:pilus assembly protein CpaB